VAEARPILAPTTSGQLAWETAHMPTRAGLLVLPAVGEGEYFLALLPDGSRLVHPIAFGERFPLNYGREVLAELAGVPHRRGCCQFFCAAVPFFLGARRLSNVPSFVWRGYILYGNYLPSWACWPFVWNSAVVCAALALCGHTRAAWYGLAKRMVVAWCSGGVQGGLEGVFRQQGGGGGAM
jgi:hypothetical protein